VTLNYLWRCAGFCVHRSLLANARLPLTISGPLPACGPSAYIFGAGHASYSSAYSNRRPSLTTLKPALATSHSCPIGAQRLPHHIRASSSVPAIPTAKRSGAHRHRACDGAYSRLVPSNRRQTGVRERTPYIPASSRVACLRKSSSAEVACAVTCPPPGLPTCPSTTTGIGRGRDKAALSGTIYWRRVPRHKGPPSLPKPTTVEPAETCTYVAAPLHIHRLPLFRNETTRQH
jgi:hypothetical protein